MFVDMSLLKILLITLLVFLPFGEIIRIGIGNDIYVKPMDVIAVILAVWVCILYIKNVTFRKTLRWYYLLFPFVGLLSLGINSYWLHSSQWFASSLYLVRWVGYASIFLAIQYTNKPFRKILYTIAFIDGIALVLIGYLQYFLYSDLRNLIYLGWDDHRYRMFSSFFDPNFAGTMFVLYLIFIAGRLFDFTKTVKKRNKIVLSAIFLLTLIALLLTYSRGALVMLLVSSFTFLWLLQKKKFMVVLVGIIAIFLVSISPFFYLENVNLFRVASVNARIHANEDAFAVIAANPLIGVGFDSYRYAQEKYHFQKKPPKFPSHSDAGVDASLLFVLATTGIVGLVSYLYLWFRLVSKARNVYKKEMNMLAAVTIASSAGLFINALFINSLFYPAVMLWMWMLFGFIEEKD